MVLPMPLPIVSTTTQWLAQLLFRRSSIYIYIWPTRSTHVLQQRTSHDDCRRLPTGRLPFP